MEGPDAVAGVISQLEGFEAPAAAWETEILPARVNEYDPAWLDELSLALLAIVAFWAFWCGRAGGANATCA